MRTLRAKYLLMVLVVAFSSAAAQEVRDVPDPDPTRQLEQLEVADGFEINLFAAEPMIAKPVRMAWDERGRLWVVGTTTYPQPEPGVPANDKIYVLEDTDRDGRADSSIVFADGLQMPTGIAVGDGGVYVGNSNELLHLKDKDGDGRADERRVVFRGFGQDDTHHLINTFRWGPDGALYFNQGIYTYSNVETPWGMRRLHGGGIWRMDSRQHRLEVYTRGMVNPWGHEFDAWGQSLATDGADYQGIYYLFPGAQFNAALGADRILAGLNADHPKYAGIEILSGRHLPDSLQGDVLTNDYRANRVKRFALSEDGSGYRSQDAGPLVWSRHVAFRPVDVRMGPDGAIYIADWYNPIIQHGEIDFRDPRRDHEHGRIWRITAKGRSLVEAPDLEDAGASELFEALALPEQWTRREARRLLRERGTAEVEPALDAWTARLDPNDEPYERLLLEALWVAQSVDVIDEELLLRVLQSQDPRARAAAVRVLSAWHENISDADALIADAVRDEHPRVRLEAVTALRRRGTADAARAALQVLDAPMDRFLDHALWITMQELQSSWLERLKATPDYFGEAAKLTYALKTSRDPYAIARLGRMLDRGDVSVAHRSDVLDAIAQYGSPGDLQVIFERALAVSQGDVERGAIELLEALERAARRGSDSRNEGSVIQAMGAETDARPAGRPAEGLARIAPLFRHDDDRVAASAARLTGHWGLTALRDELIQMAEAPSSSTIEREASVEALADLNDDRSAQALAEMTGPDRPLELRLLAAATLADIDLDRAARTAVELFNDLGDDADAAPVYRAILEDDDGTRALAAALEGTDIPDFVARVGLEVIRSKGWRWRDSNAHAADLQQGLEAISGPLPPPSVPQNPSAYELDRLELDAKAEGDPARGEYVYRRSELACQTCHAIGGAGGQSGPDLSSIGAIAPVDYIIEAVLMPDKTLKDGFSALMPAGLTASLEEGEFLDLIRFMSDLGASDAFTPHPGWVRTWRVAAADEKAAEVLEGAGPAGFVEQQGDLSWQARYSMVSGELPLDDLPMIAHEDGRVSVVRFEVEVSRAGSVKLDLGNVDGLSLWVGRERFAPLQKVVSVDLPEGTHRFMLVVERGAREEPLAVQVLDRSAARVQPVLGR